MNATAVTKELPEQPILAVSGVYKRFGQTLALAGADFTLKSGEIHALLGANGAGKSTLSKIISGHHTADNGTLNYNGAALHLRSTREAIAAGISIVMQETTLASDLSVLENIFLPELGRPGRLNMSRMRKSATEVLEQLGVLGDIPLDEEVSQLSAAQRQLVEIAKALALNARLIIFDEPTASLSPSEVERLFDVMMGLKTQDHALIFVSHRLEEVFAITDRVTIMREGKTVMNNASTAELSQGDIIKAMVGREIGAIYTRSQTMQPTLPTTPAIIEVESLSTLPAVRDVSFSVSAGEIVGLGGLVGAGRSETAEALFGLRPMTGGTLRLHGKTMRFRSPTEAIRAGLGFVPEDRRVQNIVPDLSVKENLLLAHLGAHKGFGLGYRQRAADIDTLLTRLGLPSHRLLDASMLDFSGGMQQKIIMARWLLLKPKVMILDEPTKGVDIGTRQTIYQLLQRCADDGVAVLVISSDFEELLGITSRVVVISDGCSVANVPSATLDEERLTLLAAPRTSMGKTTQVLRELSHRYNGEAFWALLNEDSLICLSHASGEQGVNTGLQTGQSLAFGDTRIPQALRHRQNSCITEERCDLTTVIVPVLNRRGHELGHIGLSVTGRDVPLPVNDIQRAVDNINA
ncbi:sugar ABC transporter ATP-binding protein [Granulosicoccus sp.]|nr:sugar ABC transporter ATP-binding protein [Granulosicoccus sp.]